MDSGSRLSRNARFFIRTFGVARAGTIEPLASQHMEGLCLRVVLFNGDAWQRGINCPSAARMRLAPLTYSKAL